MDLPSAQWPITGEFSETLKEMRQTAWAIRDAADDCDIIQVNNLFGLPYADFTSVPVVHTIHHERVDALSEFYSHYPHVHYVTISDFQRRRETMPNMRTIHHGIDLSCYRFGPREAAIFKLPGTHRSHQGPAPGDCGREKDRHSTEDRGRDPAYVPRLFRN